MNPSWQNIDHVVVLMQENLSFDRVFGWTRELGADGVPEGVDFAIDHPLFATGATLRPEPGASLIPPGAAHMPWDMAKQLHGGPNGAGFIETMLHRAEKEKKITDDQRRELVREGLRYHRRDDLPVYRDLVANFTLADRWFAPIASATWPNRYFLHMGTSPTGAEPFPELNGGWPSIFSRLTEAGPAWRIYVDGPATLITSRSVVHAATQARRKARAAGASRDDADPIRAFDRFLCDVSRTDGSAWPPGLPGHDLAGVDRLPAYTFIEPRHWPSKDLHPNNDHHHTHLHDGQRLVANIYNALRADPIRWARTLFVVTYDEHGGYWDHVEPPAAPHPGTGKRGIGRGGTALDWYGGRVPALLISPLLRQGVYSHVCDHTSVLAFLERRFQLEPLTLRDGTADDLTAAFGDELRETPARLAPPPLPAAVPVTGDLDKDLTSLGLSLYRLHAEQAGVDGDAELRELDLETIQQRGEARAGEEEDKHETSGAEGPMQWACRRSSANPRLPHIRLGTRWVPRHTRL